MARRRSRGSIGVVVLLLAHVGMCHASLVHRLHDAVDPVSLLSLDTDDPKAERSAMETAEKASRNQVMVHAMCAAACVIPIDSCGAG